MLRKGHPSGIRSEEGEASMRFKDKVVVVTGAGSGIGRAIALRFAEEGADVSIPDIAQDRAEKTAESVDMRGRRSLVVQTDVSDSAQVQKAIAETIEKLGKIDILVCNAGINVKKLPEEFTDEDWRKVLGTNLDGVWYCCRYVLPHFLDRGAGCIVNIASIGAYQTSYDRAPYMASKGGVVSLTKALALDLAERNIRVNAVAPGMTATGMSPVSRNPELDRMTRFLSPMRRWGEPEEVANAVLFLASDEASIITGTVLFADGGMTAGNQIGRSIPR